MSYLIPLIGYKKEIRSTEFKRIFGSAFGGNGYFAHDANMEVSSVYGERRMDIKVSGVVLGLVAGKFFRVQNDTVDLSGYSNWGESEVTVFYKFVTSGDEEGVVIDHALTSDLKTQNYSDYDDRLVIAEITVSRDGVRVNSDPQIVDGASGASGGSVDENEVVSIIADLLDLRGGYFGNGTLRAEGSDIYLDGELCMITKSNGLICVKDTKVSDGGSPKGYDQSSSVVIGPNSGDIMDVYISEVEEQPGWPDDYSVVADVIRKGYNIDEIIPREPVSSGLSAELVVTDNYIPPEKRKAGSTYFVYGEAGKPIGDKIPYRVKPDLRLKKVDWD